GVVGDHEGQLELVEAFPFDGHADHAAGVADHERHGLGGGLLGGHDEVALVLPVGVVDDHDQLPAGDRGDGVLDLGERHDDLQGSGHGWVSMRSTYLAITSASRFTGSPGWRAPKVVTARVWGMSATPNSSP